MIVDNFAISTICCDLMETNTIIRATTTRFFCLLTDPICVYFYNKVYMCLWMTDNSYLLENYRVWFGLKIAVLFVSADQDVVMMIKNGR